MACLDACIIMTDVTVVEVQQDDSRRVNIMNMQLDSQKMNYVCLEPWVFSCLLFDYNSVEEFPQKHRRNGDGQLIDRMEQTNWKTLIIILTSCK